MFSFKKVLIRRRTGAGIIILVLVLLFAGCSDGGGGQTPSSGSSVSLNGTWESYDSYTINTSSKKIDYNDFKADIVNSPNYGAKSGVLIIQFTWYYEIIYDENWEIVSEGETDNYNGKYGAIYWTDLTSDSVKMANAYDTTTWEHAMYDTIEEANANFTIDSTGDFISQWGTYSKI